MKGLFMSHGQDHMARGTSPGIRRLQYDLSFILKISTVTDTLF
jgi:hypothetical protein